jgi:hypothetical protein
VIDQVLANPGYSLAWLACAIGLIYVCTRLDALNGSLLRRHPPRTQRYWSVLGLRALVRIAMAASAVALFIFSPVQCSSQHNDGCRTETDNRGTHVVCE